MITVQILEDTDIVTGEEWCRPLNIVSMSGGMSDSYSFNNMGKPENNAKWCKAKDIFGDVWFNKPLSVIRKGVLNKFINYEFVVGDIPKQHLLNMSNYTSLSVTLKRIREVKEEE